MSISIRKTVQDTFKKRMQENVQEKDKDEDAIVNDEDVCDMRMLFSN